MPAASDEVALAMVLVGSIDGDVALIPAGCANVAAWKFKLDNELRGDALTFGEIEPNDGDI